MPEPKVGKTKDGNTLHYVVDAFIEKDGKFLLIDRAHPPLGFAGISGHIDEGEVAEKAIVREVQEESGLTVTQKELLFEKIDNQEECCSRGIKHHYRYFFKCEVEGEIKRSEQETKSIGWYTPEEIKQLTLEPIWDYWFKKLKVL